MTINGTIGDSASTSNSLPVVIGAYETREGAERAIEELHGAGFDSEQIGFVMRDTTTPETGGLATGKPTKGESGVGATGATMGLLSGGMAGGVLGALAGMMIPGYGAAVAAGLVAGMLMGGATGGVLGALIGLGLSDDEARFYEGQFEQGRALVAVRSNERREQALDILRRHGARQITTQKQEIRA